MCSSIEPKMWSIWLMCSKCSTTAAACHFIFLDLLSLLVHYTAFLFGVDLNLAFYMLSEIVCHEYVNIWIH